MLHLPGQQVAGDVEQGAQGREGGQPVMPAQEGFPGMNQDEAQLIPGDGGGTEGLAENDMPVAAVFRPSSRKRSARALTDVFSRPARTFSASISFL